MTVSTFLWILGISIVIYLLRWLRAWWIAGRPARGRRLYDAGFAYVQDYLNEHGDSWEVRQALWDEHDEGMDFDPGPFELGMRTVLNSLGPIERHPT